MVVTTKDIYDFLVVTILYKLVFLHGLSSLLNYGLKMFFKNVVLKSERNLAIWMHYRNQAMHRKDPAAVEHALSGKGNTLVS